MEKEDVFPRLTLSKVRTSFGLSEVAGSTDFYQHDVSPEEVLDPPAQSKLTQSNIQT